MSEYSGSSSATNKSKAKTISEDDGFESQSTFSNATASTSTKATKERGRRNPRSLSPGGFSQVSSLGKDTGISTTYSGEEDGNDAEEDDENVAMKPASPRCYKRFIYGKVSPVSIPATVRLSVQKETYMDKHRKKIPLPEAALPIMSLPVWRTLSLDHKIPNIPAPQGAIILARGQLGEMIRAKKQQYSTEDPYNFETTVGPYNSLHDPFASSYLRKPMVKKLLLKQGLINENDQVLCSLKQFNQYRKYLKTIYNQSLEQCIQQEEHQMKQDGMLKKAIDRYESKVTAQGYLFIQSERRRAALNTIRARRDEFLKKMERKEERDNRSRSCMLTNKMRERINTSLLAEAKNQMHRERIRMLKNSRACRSQEIKMIIAAKERDAQDRMKTNRRCVIEAYQHFVREWLTAKVQHQENALHRNEAVLESLEADAIKRTLKRQQRIENYRRYMGSIQNVRKKRERYLWGLAHKYFYKWLAKIRARRAARPDERHQSLWDVTSALKTTVKFLENQSGYSKLDDFILNVARLKQKIQAQLEKEEAEERQQMTAEHSTEEEEGCEQEEGNIPPAPTPSVPEPSDTEIKHLLPSKSKPVSSVKIVVEEEENGVKSNSNVVSNQRLRTVSSQSISKIRRSRYVARNVGSKAKSIKSVKSLKSQTSARKLNSKMSTVPKSKSKLGSKRQKSVAAKTTPSTQLSNRKPNQLDIQHSNTDLHDYHDSGHDDHGHGSHSRRTTEEKH